MNTYLSMKKKHSITFRNMKYDEEPGKVYSHGMVVIWHNLLFFIKIYSLFHNMNSLICSNICNIVMWRTLIMPMSLVQMESLSWVHNPLGGCVTYQWIRQKVEDINDQNPLKLSESLHLQFNTFKREDTIEITECRKKLS